MKKEQTIRLEMIIQLCGVMEKIDNSILPWWESDLINKALDFGVKNGWIHRPSTTQVEWTGKAMREVFPLFTV